MERNAMEALKRWKADPEHKPLVLRGARQVGKTWLLREFGRRCYGGDFAYFNFDAEDALGSVFESGKNPKRIIEVLSLLHGKRIEPGKTLLILDEIQRCPDALNSLKYFKEDVPSCHVVAAGSLLGTYLARNRSYPVGMVNLLDIDPLTFDEFLAATDPPLADFWNSVEKGRKIEDVFHKRLLGAYDNYLIIGGMPECVASWARLRDPARIERIQRELVDIYENDFAKHGGSIDSTRMLMVFRSIASQLAKSNEKFLYKAVRSGARGRDFDAAVENLVSAGILRRVFNVSKPEHPLPAFDRLDCFKLFMFDTGLLKHMAGLSNDAILLGADNQFRGPLAENYVLQQLRPRLSVQPRYFADKNSEIDFLIQLGSEVVPVEVKAGEDKSAPSLKRFIAGHHPAAALRFSRRGYRKDGEITNIPLYLAGKAASLV